MTITKCFPSPLPLVDSSLPVLGGVKRLPEGLHDFPIPMPLTAVNLEVSEFRPHGQMYVLSHPHISDIPLPNRRHRWLIVPLEVHSHH